MIDVLSREMSPAIADELYNSGSNYIFSACSAVALQRLDAAVVQSSARPTRGVSGASAAMQAL